MSKHKTAGIKCTSTKKWALEDITKECGLLGFYNRNYVHIESLVLNYCENANKVIRF
jgi:hypothetical protein|tara:strand:- start:3 stop:173 length:171 start_codon:yes stop_codon:yes gene_type:complete